MKTPGEVGACGLREPKLQSTLHDIHTQPRCCAKIALSRWKLATIKLPVSAFATRKDEHLSYRDATRYQY